jgi:HAD superfamily hydrolase (TIGR01509 family)
VLKGVIFDMDGVLVDSHPVHLRAWERFLRSLGRQVTQDDLAFILEGRKREEILTHFLGELSPEQLRAYGQQKEMLFREESQTIGTIPGVREFLRELNSAAIPLAVASCGGSGRVNHLLEHLHLRPYFKVVVTGDDVKDGKPDPSIFLMAAAQMNIPPGDVLALEDSVSGVQAAKSAGMRCLGIAAQPRAAELTMAGADDVVADFREISLNDIAGLVA